MIKIERGIYKGGLAPAPPYNNLKKLEKTVNTAKPY
jgi:hypothetical protein